MYPDVVDIYEKSGKRLLEWNLQNEKDKIPISISIYSSYAYVKDDKYIYISICNTLFFTENILLCQFPSFSIEFRASKHFCNIP